MVHALDVRLRQVVVPPDAGPAVRPVKELVDESEPQLRVAAEVGDFRDALCQRDVLPHPEGVVIAEPERFADADTVGRQRGDEVGRVGPQELRVMVPVYSGLASMSPCFTAAAQSGGAAEVVTTGGGNRREQRSGGASEGTSGPRWA